MRAGIFAALLVLGLSATGASAPPRHKRAARATHTVTIERMRFEPQSLVVARGDTIEWINKDLVPHTATSRAAAFDSKVIQANRSWTYTPDKKGLFTYTCALHPTMTGKLRVK